MRDKVILVNEADEQIGIESKFEAHKSGVLHRAFSVFLFARDQNSNLQVLMQQRALDKYHCGGLWTNTCCSHPQPEESVIDAGLSRLDEELGIKLPKDTLKDVGSFIYEAKFDNGLIEHELDHVLVGFVDLDLKIKINNLEVANYRWQSVLDLRDNLKDIDAQKFTPWLKPALELALL
jgi:isopentenyl-diphosphate delta-isomerase type 1